MSKSLCFVAIDKGKTHFKIKSHTSSLLFICDEQQEKQQIEYALHHKEKSKEKNVYVFRKT